MGVFLTVRPRDGYHFKEDQEEQSETRRCIVVKKFEPVDASLFFDHSVAEKDKGQHKDKRNSFDCYFAVVLHFGPLTWVTNTNPMRYETVQINAMKISLCGRKVSGHSSIMAVMKPSIVQNCTRGRRRDIEISIISC